MQDPKEPNVVSFDEVVAQARRAHEFNDEWRKAVDKAMTENATKEDFEAVGEVVKKINGGGNGPAN